MPTRQSRADNDAIQLLKSDHADVKKKFAEYEGLVKAGADDESRRDLAETICSLLTAHTMIEEELFYPAAREAIEEQDLLDEAEVEHASAKDLIEQIQDMDPGDPLYDAKVKVLGEYVMHHVKEEEGELFPKVKKADMDLKSLAEDMATRKADVLESLGAEAPQ